MRPRKLKVKNFAGYVNETFSWDDAPDLFAIIGRNGAGKSTFFVDAITACLFNRARGTDSRGSGLEGLIKTNSGDHFEVEFSFDINGQNISVIRRRFEKSQELEIYIDGVDHSEKIKETQDKINKIIKMDYDTFLDTTCIGQGKSGSFMEKKPNDRKEVFTQVLGLDRYDVLEELTKEKRKEQDAKVKELTLRLSDLEESVGDKEVYENNITTGQDEIGKLEFEIELKDKELEKELIEKAQHEQLVKSANEILSKKSNLKDQISNVEGSISKGESLREQLQKTLVNKDNVLSSISDVTKIIEDLQTQQTELSNEKSSLEGKNEFLTNQAKEIKAKYTRLKDFNQADCEFCGQQVTETHKNSHLTQMSNEGKILMGQINANKSRIEEIDVQLRTVKSQFSENRLELKSLQDSKTTIDQAEAKLPGVESRIDELAQNLTKVLAEYDEVSKIEVENVESRIFRDASIRNELNSLRNSLSGWQSKIAIAQNELKKIADNSVKIKDYEDQIKEAKRVYAIYDDLTTAWGKKGIQAVIIDSSLTDIQQEINDFLKLLSEDGKVSIEFRTQKGKNNAVETLDIIVNDEYGSRVYETYSGGEKFRIDFACHVGLAKFLSKRAGSPIDFFIIDEGIGSQDDVAKEQFIIAVNKLSTMFSKVMVITHIPDVIESFKDRVEVYKDPVEGSKVRILA